MRIKITMLAMMLWCAGASWAQLIQGTIKPGGTADQFEVWLRPDFTNSTQYLFQIGMPIAFPAGAVPQPTGINVVLDPTFVTNFGSNYSVTVNPVANATGGTEKYFNIVLVRGGAGASVAQSWSAGTAFKVLTGTFTYGAGLTTFMAKLADYQDGGGDGQGNFYTQSGNSDFYVTANSIGNFYAVPGSSTVGGTASAGFAQIDNTPLPVHLMGFSGVRMGNKNVLQWSTSGETNNQGFDVQRSSNGYAFQSIGFVSSGAARGNSAASLQYSFSDVSPTGSQQFYRLAQQDRDGRTLLSGVVLIRDRTVVALTMDGIFPNPGVDRVHVVLVSPGKEKVVMRIVDGVGRMVMEREVIVVEGTNSIPIEVYQLVKGGYVVEVRGEKGEKLVGRFLRQ